MTERFRAERVFDRSAEFIQLTDTESGLSVSIAPTHGNIAYKLLYQGEDWLWTPFGDPLHEMAGSTALFGIPLLSPWANRLSSDVYSVHGVEYTLNRRIANLRVDHNHLAMHGLVMFAPWTVIAVGTDSSGAYSRSTLDFTKKSEWMAQFPFAHRLELTHRISEGRLSVFLSVTNDSCVPMPLLAGFHPYFKLPGQGDRTSWNVRCCGRKRMILSDLFIPTGETGPLDLNRDVSLQNGTALDDLYTDLARDESGHAIFSLGNTTHHLTVGFGHKYPAAVIYAPSQKDLVCIEPMTAPTDALKLTQSGLYHDLQYVAPGGTWTECFWIKPAIRNEI